MFTYNPFFTIRYLVNINHWKFRCLSVLSTSSSVILNSSMKKLIESRKYKAARDLFHRQSQISTDVTITLALKASSKIRDHQRGIQIHQQLSATSLANPFIQTSLIHFYMQCNDVHCAEKIFLPIGKKTVFMYGAMFKGYMSNEMPEKVIELFQNISVEPDEIILILLFNACAKFITTDSIKFGQDLLNRLPINFLQKTKLINAAIDMLMKFGHVERAEKLFESLQKKSVVSYGAMMQGYIINHLAEKALDLYEKMPGESNEVVYAIVFSACAQLSNERAIQLGNQLLRQMPTIFKNDIVVIGAILNMLMRFGQVKDAEDLFLRMKKRNLDIYGVMMNGYKINDCPKKCLKLFEQIKQENIILNGTISLILINAASQIGIRSICQKILDGIPLHSIDSLQLNNALIDMWGKSGDIKQAKQIFESIAQPDMFTYSSMINAYARNGMGAEAVVLYWQIPEHFRDKVTHICVLHACSHAGLIDQARRIFNQIDRKTEEIFVTMVDCFSRMFMFDEAQTLVDDYEKTNPPCSIMYMTLLSASRNQRNSVLSQKLYDRMTFLFPNEKLHLVPASILLSNTYISVGDGQKVEQIRNNRIERFGSGIKVGLSWTEVNNELVEFTAHDRSHPRSSEIYAELHRLSDELKEHGHQYDSIWLTRPLQDGETVESVLCGHSEKLAIAFNLIQEPRPSFIQIIKNLRVCGDCHSATKIIAKIRQCEIVIRDASRIHHFYTNGQCSCQDHF